MSKKKMNNGEVFSFYVGSQDLDFINAVKIWTKNSEINFSALTILSLKEFIFSKSEIFKDFYKVYSELIDQNIENTFIEISGHRFRLSDLIKNPKMIFNTSPKIR